MRQHGTAVAPVAALDHCPSSLGLEPLIELAPAGVQEGSTALAQLLATARPDLAAQLPEEHLDEPEPDLTPYCRGRKRRHAPSSLGAKRQKTVRPPVPTRWETREPAAVQLLHTQVRWLLPPCDTWDDGVLPCALSLLADEAVAIRARLSTLVPVRFDGVRSTRTVAPDLYLFTCPEGDAAPTFVAALPTLSYAGARETNGPWLHAAARLAQSGHVAIEAMLRVERAPSGADEGVAVHPTFALRLEVRVSLAALAFHPSFSAQTASDFADVLSFASAEPKAADADAPHPDPVHAATVTEFLDALHAQADTLRQTRADASWVYSVLRRPAPSEEGDIASVHALSSVVLLPYQRRTLGFLLGREGKRFVSVEKSEEVVPAPEAKESRPQGQLTDLAANASDPQVMTTFGPQNLGMWWDRIHLRSLGDQTLYFNTVYGYFTFDAAKASTGDVKASLLAEEMGLGKTVELLFLILWNTAPPLWRDQTPYWSEWLQAMISPSKATLIVVPETLREQWIEEVRRHAPALRVYSFESTKKAEKDATDLGLSPQALDEGRSLSAWDQYAKTIDVVITTYATLSTEVHKALAEPPRSRRNERKYPRDRSGLVTVGWWRVAVDEVQLLGSTTQAFTTASLLPRHMSVCVSGTPVQSIKDLDACLAFLRVPGLAWPEEGDPQLGPVSDAAAWILDRRMKPQLMRLLAWIGVRHSKHDVRAEMVLPPQMRQLVPVEMTRTERAFYLDIYRRAMGDMDLWGLALEEILSRVRSDRGGLTQDLSDLVRRLRQACTHPQVVARSNLGALWGLRLRSIDDVLVLMIEQGHSEQINATLLSFQRKITRGSLILQNLEDPDRLTEALGLLGDVADELVEAIERLVQEADRAHLSGPLYSFTEQTLTQALKTQSGEAGDDGEQELAEGEEEKHLADQLKARSHYLSTTRGHVLRYREQLHRAYQFLGNTYFQLGEAWEKKQSELRGAEEPTGECQSSEAAQAKDVGGGGNIYKVDEDRMYQLAEQLRRLLLNESSELVSKAVDLFTQRRLDAETNVLATPPPEWLVDEVDKKMPLPMVGGHMVNMCLRWIALANKQAQCLFRWRGAIFERLSQAVNRDVDLEKQDDDQFAENLDRQHEAEAYLDMYRVLLSEREYLVTGVDVVGARDRPLLFRQLEMKVRDDRLRRLLDSEMEESAEAEAARQQLEVFRRLETELKDVVLPGNLFPLRKLVAELRNLADRVLNQVDAQLVGSLQSVLRAVLSEQTKLLDRAKRDSALLMAIYNARSTYFKRIQQLSDTVSDAQARDIPRAIETNKNEERKAAKELGNLAARVRYLENLRAAQEGGLGGERTEAPDCIVCTDRIVNGVLLDVCGHLVCEDCFRQWTQRQQRNTCPVCRTRLRRGAGAVHRVTYRVDGDEAAETLSKAVDHTSVSLGLIRAKEGPIPGWSAAASPGVRQVNLDAMNVIDAQQRVDALETPVAGSHGCKVDMLVGHLRHIILHSTDKALVFSSFARGLDVVGAALRQNEILFVRSDASGGRMRESRTSTKHCASVFQNNPAVRVFLLHADSQASGLNLTAARHVFLLAPQVNKGMEMQAIGRVHRIGQTKPTHVWGYFVLDSVEETLLHLTAQKGHSLFSKDASPEDDGAEAGEMSVAMPARKDHGGDLVTSRDDLIACLFPRSDGSA